MTVNAEVRGEKRLAQTCYGFRHSLIIERFILKNLQELCPQYKNARLEKLQLLNFVFAEMDPPCRSFADLGGNWNVDGCYTHFALDHYDIERAFLVDTDFSDSTIERSKSYKNLQVVRGNFGDASTIDAIGSVDVIFLFDVLLHQVRPNWDEILRLYSTKTKVMAIYNQQFTNFQSTTRLLDLGWDEYFANVPHTREEYATLLQKTNEIHPIHNRPYRDLHNYWQWAITDDDLIATARRLGFSLGYYANCGQFGNLPQCEEHAFIFSSR
jgi:hypothetical protein